MKDRSKSRILLAEDDSNLGSILAEYLELKGYFVHLCVDGEDAYQAFKHNYYDILILDVMMPRKDGFTLVNEIRKEDKVIPIIFLTAKVLKEDRIKGLKIGADDYLTKPFSMEELQLRIKAVLKRYKHSVSKNDSTYKVGKFNFDYTRQIIAAGRKEEKLTSKEADLLQLLCSQRNEVVTREKILTTIWGDYDYFKGRSMDVFIARLRKYLNSDGNVNILNVHGTGYKLVVNE